MIVGLPCLARLGEASQPNLRLVVWSRRGLLPSNIAADFRLDTYCAVLLVQEGRIGTVITKEADTGYFWNVRM